MKGNKYMTTSNITYPAIALFALASLALSPTSSGVSPAPGGCYPLYTTAEGCSALQLLTTGAGNTGVGWSSLSADSTGSYNTALGTGALILNNGDSNTALGAAALLLNTTGGLNTAVGTDALVYNDLGTDNTALGAFALFSNTTADGNIAVGYQALFYSNVSDPTLEPNTAVGSQALYSNTTGSGNTANGHQALYSNTTGDVNTAIGGIALLNNTTGHRNTATGFQTLINNTEGYRNTADGYSAMFFNTTGNFNTTCGWASLEYNQTGSMNTALGFGAGYFLEGDNNIAIGTGGDPADSNTIRIGNVVEYVDPDSPFEVHPIHTTTYIAGISGQTAADGVAVFINSDGKLGTLTSSARFKDDIKPMDRASEAVLALKPVTFCYKHEIDPKGIPQFGLVAEDVEKVNPDLVARDADGKAYTVRYEAVNAMLLNEFLKEHRNVEQLTKDFESKLAKQQKQIEALTAGLQKVSAQIEMSCPAPQLVHNGQ